MRVERYPWGLDPQVFATRDAVQVAVATAFRRGAEDVLVVDMERSVVAETGTAFVLVRCRKMAAGETGRRLVDLRRLMPAALVLDVEVFDPSTDLRAFQAAFELGGRVAVIELVTAVKAAQAEKPRCRKRK